MAAGYLLHLRGLHSRSESRSTCAGALTVAGCCWLSDLPDCFLELNNDDPTVEIPQFDSENATHYTSGLVLPSSCLEPSWEPRRIRVCRPLQRTRPCCGDSIAQRLGHA